MSTFPVDDARRILRTAFIEDVRTGDITCRIVLPPGHRSRARVVAKESGILAGLPLLPLAIEELAALDPDALAGETTWSTPQEDGTPFDAGDTLIELEGPTRAILELERVLLNLLQHLCGVALAAATYQKAAGPTCKVLDTRKTTPGQRTLEKWAIVQGGGSNHRMGLWDAILIKENHVAAVGSARAAACMALASRPEGMDVIAEVRSSRSWKPSATCHSPASFWTISAPRTSAPRAPCAMPVRRRSRSKPRGGSLSTRSPRTRKPAPNSSRWAL